MKSPSPPPREDRRTSPRIAVVGEGIRAGILRSLVRRHYTLVPTLQVADLVFVDMAHPSALDHLREALQEGRRVVAVMDADEALDMGATVLQEGVRTILYAPFRAENVRNLVEGIFLEERVEAEVEDSFRALQVTLAHHILNALTPMKLKSTSLLRRIRQGETIPRDELQDTLERFLKAVERVERLIRDLQSARPQDREVYHGRETMIRLRREGRDAADDPGAPGT